LVIGHDNYQLPITDPFDVFYIFHGDDPHSQQETLAELKARLGDPAMLELNTTQFQGAGLDLSQLRHACDSMPFLAARRLVIVHDFFGTSPGKEVLDELLAYLPRLPETTRLVFRESRPLTAKHPAVRLAQSEKSGYVKSFSRPEGHNLERWIRERVEAGHGRITPRATHSLAVNVGSELHALANEIEKLLLYKAGETIEEEDVNVLSPYAAEASIFELVDALGNRNGRVAALLLQKEINEGADPFYLFSMFVRQFRLLIQVKELSEEGVRPPEIAKKLKIHTFVAGKVAQQSHTFSLAQLEQIYSHLLEIDVGVKSGRTDMATAIDLFVSGITAAENRE
jgi:DNA polymerase III subunit delta